METRAAVGHAPWESFEPAAADRAMWFRFDEQPIGEDGMPDPLALVVFADLMPGAAGEKIRRLTAAVVRTERRPHIPPVRPVPAGVGAGAQPGSQADDGYSSAEMSLWDGDRLVAYATQIFFFTFLD